MIIKISTCLYLKSFFIALAILLTSEVLGQSDKPQKKRGITLGFGLRTFLINDEVGSNLNYQGNGFSLHIQHDVISEKYARDFNVFLITGNIGNDFNHNTLDGVFLSVDYHWRFRMSANLPWKVKWFLGPYGKGAGFARNFNFNTNRVEVTTGDVFGSIGVSSLMQKELSKDRYLELGFTIPLLTYMINREFIGSTTTEWMFSNRFADYQMKFTYADKILKAVEWIIAYQYQLVIIDRSTRVAHEGHLFETGLKFTF